MECRAYGICLDSQSRGYLGKDRKVSSAAGGNLSRMHKTQETAKESRLNFMYSHLRNRTLATGNGKFTAGLSNPAAVATRVVRHKNNPRPRRSNVLPENIRDPFRSVSIPAGAFAAETNTTGRSDVREFTVGLTSSN